MIHFLHCHNFVVVGIIYCFSRKDAEDVSKELKKLGIAAGFYHADMHAVERSRIHTRWLSNNIQVNRIRAIPFKNVGGGRT